MFIIFLAFRTLLLPQFFVFGAYRCKLVTLFGVLTLPLQYCLCSVTPLPPPQLTFFRGSRNTSLCPHLPKGLVLSPPPCASFTQPSEPNSSGCHYRRPPWQKYCLDKEQVNTNNPGRRSLLWLSWLRPSELIWCVSRVLPPPPFLPLGPHFNNRRCYVRGGGAWREFIRGWRRARPSPGILGESFQTFVPPPSLLWVCGVTVGSPWGSHSRKCCSSITCAFPCGIHGNSYLV